MFVTRIRILDIMPLVNKPDPQIRTKVVGDEFNHKHFSCVYSFNF